LVVEARDEAAVRQANGGFHTVESIPASWLDRLHAWAFRRVFKGDRGNLTGPQEAEIYQPLVARIIDPEKPAYVTYELEFEKKKVKKEE
jgi:hypothetical protein